jgi:hypothetical protein
MVARYPLGHQIKRKDLREWDIVKLTAAVGGSSSAEWGMLMLRNRFTYGQRMSYH